MALIVKSKSKSEIEEKKKNLIAVITELTKQLQTSMDELNALN